MNQSLFIKPKLLVCCIIIKIQVSQSELQKNQNQSAHEYTPFKGKCLTGKAHYSPFAFSVNKKSITKIPHSKGKLKGKFSRKTCGIRRHSRGNSSGFFQYFLQFVYSTKNQLIANFFNHLGFFLSLTL